ncbi:M48 family metalloprotease [Halobacteriovorax sp. HLS]|uniref:M48 family metalloprotease n=1 Tax=Halobacteriovorax sp. HLS TaxID=2234000 RepID=UPI000FD7FC6A|nr:M48 family metalloprotease [Halobacteriovorax sp. HLS]
MNFWEKQRQSRSKTRSYIYLFLLSVVGIIIAVNIVGIYTYISFVGHNTSATGFFSAAILKCIAITTCGTILIISGAYFLKKLQLSSGGRSVAKMLGARELKGELTEKELIYRNVVEEISIASGVAIPAIFVLDRESSINAFAAGHDINDCAICVTQGTLDYLDRDELQAVVAHEYGHIFNGDMLLNMRLIAVLFGILVIGEIGRVLMRARSSRRTVRRSNSKDSSGSIVIVGLAIFVVGYIGHFFASLIQARISREREYLADSCSVQYTRNPQSLIRLFKKIYLQQTKWISSTSSKQIAHMFFSQGLSLNSMMATHPTILSRIEHVDPKFDRENFLKNERHDFEKEVFDEKWKAQEKKKATQHLIKKGLINDEENQVGIINRIGSVDDASLVNSQNILNTLIPLEVRNFLYKKQDCVLVIYSLFVDHNNFKKRQDQIDLLRERLDESSLQSLIQIVDNMISMPQKARFSLIELAMPALKRLKSKDRDKMFEVINVLIFSDSKTNVREFLLLSVLESLINENKLDTRYKKGSLLTDNLEEVSVVLSFWNLTSNNSKNDTSSFSQAIKELGVSITLRDKSQLNYKCVKQSLESLKFLKDEETEKLIKSLVRGILSDNVVTPIELMYLKMVCLILSVPFPQID